MAHDPNSPDAPQRRTKPDPWWGEALKKLNEQLDAYTPEDTAESATTPRVASFVPRRLNDSQSIDNPEAST